MGQAEQWNLHIHRLPTLHNGTLVSANISQQMIVDSVKFVSTSYPYQVRTYARQYVVRESTVSQYSFVSTCQLINAGRSDVNPHGLIIEKFKVVENNLVETRKR